MAVSCITVHPKRLKGKGGGVVGKMRLIGKGSGGSVILGCRRFKGNGAGVVVVVVGNRLKGKPRV